MATSVFVGNSSSSELEMSLMNGSGYQNTTRTHTGKPGGGGGGGGGRRKSKKPTQKDKIAKRGMGVEQLERLNFQERIKKMTETNTLHPSSFQNQHFTTLPLSPAFGAYSIINNGGGSGGRDGVVGQVGDFDVHQSEMLLQGLGNHHVVHSLGTFHADPFAVGSGFRGGTETSIELSSIPNNLKWNSSEQCGICYKKFRGNRENLTCNNGEMSGFGSFCNGSKGNMFINGGNPYYGPKPTSGQEVDAMAVHQNGMKKGEGSPLTEYEFFPPGKVGESYCNFKDEETINMASSSSRAAVEASCDHQDFVNGVHHHEEEGGGSNTIDLTLKLSY